MTPIAGIWTLKYQLMITTFLLILCEGYYSRSFSRGNLKGLETASGLGCLLVSIWSNCHCLQTAYVDTTLVFDDEIFGLEINGQVNTIKGSMFLKNRHFIIQEIKKNILL